MFHCSSLPRTNPNQQRRSRPLHPTMHAAPISPLATPIHHVSSSSSGNPHQLRNTSSSSLPSMWRDLHGADNWRNLLHPLHPLLRHELIRYARFVLSSYKSFDHDPSSSRYLHSKHPTTTLLPQTGHLNSPYRVINFLYATPAASPRPHCIGFIAVSDDRSLSSLGRRDVLVSFRGTVTAAEWLTNLMTSLTAARLHPLHPRPVVKVESGFLALYTSDACRAQLLPEICRVLKLYAKEELSITLAGHSMGSSLAILLGYDVAELGLNRVGSGRGTMGRVIPVTVFSYGGPRVGNSGFRARCEELGVKVLRVANVRDPVTNMPGLFLNERLGLSWGGGSGSCYAHVGVELALDFFKIRNYPACVHDLEAYIGCLQLQGRGGKEDVEKDGGGDMVFLAG